MNMVVNWFEVVGKDADKLHAFYTSVFGWDLTPMPEMPSYRTLAPADGGIGGGIGKAQDGGPGWTTFYVEVDEVEAAMARAVQAGGEVLVPPVELPMVTIAVLRDPEGHVVGIGKSKPAA